MKRLSLLFTLLWSSIPALAAPANNPEPFWLTDKTLVVWVRPLTNSPGFMGAVCIRENSSFDGIALTGGETKKWIAWSDFLRRTAKGQKLWPIEAPTNQTTTPVCVATVYKDNTVSIYRNGQHHLTYRLEPQPFSQFSQIVSGFDHQLPCEIHELRLYNVALSPREVEDLRLRTVSGPVPLAQWTFENGSLADRRGCFRDGILQGEVKVTDGKLIFASTSGATFTAKLPPNYSRNPKKYQTGFYTAGFKEPDRMGRLWDTWVYYYRGKYYQYFDAGICGSTAQYDLAVSDDGVVWKEIGKVLEPKAEATCLGTGTIIEAPGFSAQKPKWQLNYTETIDDKQSIMFATSTDLIHWNKLGEELRFHPDNRWYDPAGRWDCLDYLRLEDGALYGYFTANPRGESVTYQACGFGIGESKNGLDWKALPPVPGNIGGEIGGIQKIGQKYYVTVGGGQIGVADSPRGPFLTQKKNAMALGQQCDVGFPRFFHNPPVERTCNHNGALLSHFFWGSLVYSSLLKDIEIDPEGIFRIRWWEQNNLLKKSRKALTLSKDRQGDLQFLREAFDLESVGVVEAKLALEDGAPEKAPIGFYFEKNSEVGYTLLLSRAEAVFGMVKRDGTDLAIFARVNHDMDFGAQGRARLVFKGDMLEAYLNDYLVMVKRVYWNGKLGLLGPRDTVGDFQGWTHK